MKVSKHNFALESILDINSSNIWTMDEYRLATLWEHSRSEEDFSGSEEKLLNTIRLAFEVAHYNENDPREKQRFADGKWALMSHCKPGKLQIAIRRKVIKRLSDLGYENVKHISAATLLELIDRNFGGGWDSIALATRDIIESAFDISTTQLPASRIHAKGGTLEKKVAQGYEVLEIAKGTWVEAIFAKKKELLDRTVIKEGLKKMAKGDEDEDDDADFAEEEEDIDGNEEEDNETSGYEEINENDDTFYSSFAPEAEMKDEEEDGFNVAVEDEESI